MSAANRTAPLTPVEIVTAPGQEEARRIRQHYQTAMAGVRAFVEMGLCLIDVKARLPHGEYMPWCAKHLSDIGYRHLHRAAKVASDLLQMANVTHCVTFENLPPEILAIIDGSTSQRALLSQVEEFRCDELEAKNKALCEKRWASDPDERDQWEPLVLAGEVSYTYAMRGMTGQELTGEPRPPIAYNKLIIRNLVSLPKCWENWTVLDDDTRTDALNKLPESISTAPLVVLHTLQKAIEDKLSGKKGGPR